MLSTTAFMAGRRCRKTEEKGLPPLPCPPSSITDTFSGINTAGSSRAANVVAFWEDPQTLRLRFASTAPRRLWIAGVGSNVNFNLEIESNNSMPVTVPLVEFSSSDGKSKNRINDSSTRTTRPSPGSSDTGHIDLATVSSHSVSSPLAYTDSSRIPTSPLNDGHHSKTHSSSITDTSLLSTPCPAPRPVNHPYHTRLETRGRSDSWNKGDEKSFAVDSSHTRFKPSGRLKILDSNSHHPEPVKGRAIHHQQSPSIFVSPPNYKDNLASASTLEVYPDASLTQSSRHHNNHGDRPGQKFPKYPNEIHPTSLVPGKHVQLRSKELRNTETIVRHPTQVSAGPAWFRARLSKDSICIYDPRDRSVSEIRSGSSKVDNKSRESNELLSPGIWHTDSSTQAAQTVQTPQTPQATKITPKSQRQVLSGTERVAKYPVRVEGGFRRRSTRMILESSIPKESSKMSTNMVSSGHVSNSDPISNSAINLQPTSTFPKAMQSIPSLFDVNLEPKTSVHGLSVVQSIKNDVSRPFEHRTASSIGSRLDRIATRIKRLILSTTPPKFRIRSASIDVKSSASLNERTEGLRMKLRQLVRRTTHVHKEKHSILGESLMRDSTHNLPIISGTDSLDAMHDGSTSQLSLSTQPDITYYIQSVESPNIEVIPFDNRAMMILSKSKRKGKEYRKSRAKFSIIPSFSLPSSRDIDTEMTGSTASRFARSSSAPIHFGFQPSLGYPKDQLSQMMRETKHLPNYRLSCHLNDYNSRHRRAIKSRGQRISKMTTFLDHIGLGVVGIGIGGKKTRKRRFNIFK